MSAVGLRTKNYCAGESESWALWQQLEEQGVAASQTPFCEDVSTDTEDIVEVRYHVTTAEDTANWEDCTCAVVAVIFGSVYLSETVEVICSYLL